MNFDWRLTVRNFFVNFQFHLFLNFESIDVNFIILATLFVKLCNSECSDNSSKRFLLLLRHRKIAKAKKCFFNLNDKNFLRFCAIALHNHAFVACTGKSLKFHRFESVQNLPEVSKAQIGQCCQQLAIAVRMKFAASHQAQIIIVKNRIKDRNNGTRVPVKPR